MSIYEPILARLNEQGGRYVVVGGLAVVLHGHARLTVDLDLVVDLAPEAARRTISALVGLGFRPLAPVEALDFADAARRRRSLGVSGWIMPLSVATRLSRPSRRSDRPVVLALTRTTR